MHLCVRAWDRKLPSGTAAEVIHSACEHGVLLVFTQHQNSHWYRLDSDTVLSYAPPFVAALIKSAH